MVSNRLKFIGIFLISLLSLYLIFGFFNRVSAQSAGWPMVAANPQRTNWTPDELVANPHIEWYRPIDAYIPNYVQVIAANDLVYISTSRGLYALKYDTGEVVWRYDSEIPLGNSPTIATVNGVSYAFVGGYDKKLHSFNALIGNLIWEFSGAKAGYQANPLLVNNTVIAANRDGFIYFLDAASGALLRQYPSAGQDGIGVVHQSPAYKNGVIYLVTDSGYAYAINENGTLRWRSPQKLPNSGFDSFWPVVYSEGSQDYIIFTGTIGFREYMLPGTLTMSSESYGFTPSEGWRIYTILRASDGSVYSPTLPAGRIANPGNQHPPTVSGINNLIYQTDAQGSRAYVKGWRFGQTGFTATTGIDSAPDEPQIVSGGGNNIFRNLCCSRIGDYQNITTGSHAYLWNYTLGSIAPGYDDKLYYLGSDFLANLSGQYGNVNGIYGYHGDQNSIISYKGKAFVHRGNSVLAFGSGTARGKLPLLTSIATPRAVTTVTDNDIKARMEKEVSKIMTAGGLLKPGYYDDSHFTTNYQHMDNYFENPGDTLYTLSIAYPYLSTSLQTQVKNFLTGTFIPKYYNPVMYLRTGWQDGVQRSGWTLPIEIINNMNTLGPNYRDGYEEKWSWVYPNYYGVNPNNFYALWKYAANVLTTQSERLNLYILVKNKITQGNCQYNDCVRVQSRATDSYLTLKPYELNAYIAGLQGFKSLQDLSGQAGVDATLRSRVDAELTRLVNLKINTFSKDTPFTTINNGYDLNFVNLSRNFLMMTPELADIMRQNKLTAVRQALAEYNIVGPYWFVSRFDAATAESAMQNLYDYPSLFQAKAYILKDSREELSKWLDAPAFEKGDLFYIQNLVAILQAPYAGSTPTLAPPSPTPTVKLGDANGDRIVDEADYTIWLAHYNQSFQGSSYGDFNLSGKVDGVDYIIWLNNYGM